MARFTREELESFRDKSVDDLIGPGLKLLFVGINPGLWTAATNTHFCHPSNRFYPAMRVAGIIDFVVDSAIGMVDDERQAFVDRGMGITNLVNRATARASELATSELRRGSGRLADVVVSVAPRVVAIAGVTAYRTAFSLPMAKLGPQTESVGYADLWVVPNPSGLNAHETIETLAVWYRRVAEEAGVLPLTG